MIFNQLWNQRRQNGWIFMELLVVSFFLWTVIDPIYVLTANRHIDSGYRPEGLYVVQMGAYNESNALYNKEQDNDSLSKAAYWRIVRLLRQQPEVKSYSISYTWPFPTAVHGAARRYMPTLHPSVGKTAMYMPSVMISLPWKAVTFSLLTA